MKKSSGKAANEKLCQGKDVFERMNYLHQASYLVTSKNAALASYYGSIMTNCAKKAVLRIDHHLKRSMCKTCQGPLIPGNTSKVRLLSKKKKIIKVTCSMCKRAKKIPTNKKKHTLWWDQPAAIVESFNYSLKTKGNDCRKYRNISNGDEPECTAVSSSNGVLVAEKTTADLKMDIS